MTTTFGPQLIGQTEKALNAILRRHLLGTGLDEARWVTLRLAGSLVPGQTATELAAIVAERAHLDDASELVADLTDLGLIEGGALTDAGRTLVADVQAEIAAATAPIWDGLPAADVSAATRVLEEVGNRARAALR
jgi:hypothetical protein